MSTFGLPELMIFAVIVVLMVVGRNLPEFLQSLVLSKKQFEERRSQVYRNIELIDYAGELNEKR